ncbi:MAG TPA: hypothetical protein ENN42_03210, partial [Thioalkalivibrio sp.]|nr:hypothetical protein [Thioalkalivibrio sp.]
MPSPRIAGSSTRRPPPEARMDSHLLSTASLTRHGLDQQPFLPQWQEAFAYGDASLDMSLNVCLEHLRGESAPVLVKGEQGIGKSALLRRLPARADDLQFCLIEAGPETSMAAVDFAVRQCWQPEARHGDPRQLSLDRYLAALCEDGMHPVLALDDAHLLEPRVLGTLFNLKQHMHNKLGQTLGLILAAERSIEPVLSLLDGKLPIVGTLHTITARPLNREQTAAYLAHRLRVAGMSGPMPLNATAVDAIQRESGGLPRDIHRLAAERLDEAGPPATERQGGIAARLPRVQIPTRLGMPAVIAMVALGLLVALFGLIAGLLGGGDDTEVAANSGSRQVLALPQETTRPAPSTPVAAAPPAKDGHPDETPDAKTASAPPETTMQPAPTAQAPSPPPTPAPFT